MITEEEVRDFEEKGVVLLRGVLSEWIPYLKEVTEDQMEHPQVTALLTGLRTFFSMDYVQAGLFLTNEAYYRLYNYYIIQYKIYNRIYVLVPSLPVCFTPQCTERSIPHGGRVR